MQWILWLLAVVAALYAAILALLYFYQRRILYAPSPLVDGAEAFGLGAQTLRCSTVLGEPFVAWYQVAAAGRPLILFFHGNGGNLSNRVALLRKFADVGWGYLAIDYPGYGASPGKPTQAALLRAGDAAYAEALALGYLASRIVAFGESLGNGVAVPLAAARAVKALVLDSSFTAAVDVAATMYWMFPVRFVMRDQYDLRELITRVDAPKLFLHASDDPVLPIGFGRALYNMAPPPKCFIEMPGRGHVVADKVFDRIRLWLESL